MSIHHSGPFTFSVVLVKYNVFVLFTSRQPLITGSLFNLTGERKNIKPYKYAARFNPVFSGWRGNGGKTVGMATRGGGGGGDYETGKKIQNLRDIRGAFEEISKGGRERHL